MCDACPAPNSMLHIYTISVFTGERLCLCLECIDHNAEPVNSVTHGINKGALDHLTAPVKGKVRIWTPLGYEPVYEIDRHIKLLLALPTPEDVLMITDMRSVIDKMPPLTLPSLSEPSPTRMQVVKDRVLQFLRRIEVAVFGSGAPIHD